MNAALIARLVAATGADLRRWVAAGIVADTADLVATVARRSTGPA